MGLKLDNSSRIAAIKESFNRKFPYLKLEFFNFSKGQQDLFNKINLITNGNKTLGEITELNKPGYINISEYQTVEELEHRFKESFGVNVQVFWRSGNVWLETTSSDYYTLGELNKSCEKLSMPMLEKYTPEDIHEQE